MMTNEEKAAVDRLKAMDSVVIKQFDPDNAIWCDIRLVLTALQSANERADRAAAAIHWRPMETAPRTGEHIQVINLDRFGFGMCGGKNQHASDVVHWFGDGFYCSIFGKDQDSPVDVYYTHWRPIEGRHK